MAVLPWCPEGFPVPDHSDEGLESRNSRMIPQRHDRRVGQSDYVECRMVFARPSRHRSAPFAAEVGTMVKRCRYATSLLLLVICGACDGVPSGLCMDFESGCSGGSRGIVQQASRFYLSGFPVDRVDRTPIVGTDGYRGTLTVGDTVWFRLYFVLSDHVGGDGATAVPIQTWAIADASVATVSREADGAVRVVATRPGELLPLVANEAWYSEVYACAAQNACRKVTDIIVVQ